MRHRGNIHGERRSAAGVSLLETLLVVTLAGIVAASAAPALRAWQGTRVAAAANDVASLLREARGRAMASGAPAGLSIAVGTSTLRAVRVEDGAAEVTKDLSVFGRGIEDVVIPRLYGGVTVALVTLGDGTLGSGTLWFDHDGTPWLRDGDGADLGAATADAAVELAPPDGPAEFAVIVRRRSGLVEVEAR